MKKLVSTLTMIGMLTTQSMASTTMIAVEGKRAQQDQRVIKITKDQNNRHLFRLCPSAQAVMQCQQIGSGSFSSSELQKKLKSEKVKKYAKGGGIAVAAILGGIAPLAFLAGTAIPTIGAGLTVGAFSLGSSTVGATSYVLTDLFGRSPLEHHEAQALLALISEEEEKVGVEDFDETFELIEELLAEVEEERSEVEMKLAIHVDNGPRQAGKNISRTSSEKLEVIHSIGR